MNIILVMSLSGSGIFFSYWIVRNILSPGIQEKTYYQILKAAILYFLLPLPFLKNAYKKLLGVFQTEGEMNLPDYYMQEDMIFFVGEQEVSWNITAKMQSIIICTWILGALFIGCIFIVRYLKRRYALLKCSVLELSEQEETMFIEVMEKYNVSKKIKWIPCEERISAFTTGFLKPIVVYSNQHTLNEKNMLIEHELVHIKNKDIFWKLMALLALGMQWYNPFAWLVYKELSCVCEYACDEEVIKGKEDGWRYNYAQLILKSSLSAKGDALEANLSKGAKEVERRMLKILNSKSCIKRNWVGAALLCVLILLNSLTVFAYEDVKVVRASVEDAEDVKDIYLNYDSAFVPDGADSIYESELAAGYEKVYDYQFVDEDGKIYEVNSEQIDTYANCTHEYVSGTAQKHVANSSGGCTVYFYEARRCNLCGTIVVGDLIGYNVAIKCTH